MKFLKNAYRLIQSFFYSFFKRNVLIPIPVYAQANHGRIQQELKFQGHSSFLKKSKRPWKGSMLSRDDWLTWQDGRPDLKAARRCFLQFE